MFFNVNIFCLIFSYEAWVIYNFLALCLEWVGGPGAVVLSLTGRVLKPNWCLMTCCFPPISLDGSVLFLYAEHMFDLIHQLFNFLKLIIMTGDS